MIPQNRKTTGLGATGIAAIVAAVATFSLCAANTASASIVYDNTVNPLGEFFTDDREFGDEITLAGSEREMTEFTFETFASGIPSDTTATLRFYANDGSDVGVATAPGSLLSGFESDPISVGSGTETHTLSGISIDVPDTFTWTVEFSNVGNGQAGLTLSSPVDVGGSFDDFWIKTDGDWDTFRFPDGNPDGNFTAQVTAVPEPSTMLFGLLGGLMFVGYRLFNRRCS